jgi:hypothetical protein
MTCKGPRTTGGRFCRIEITYDDRDFFFSQRSRRVWRSNWYEISGKIVLGVAWGSEGAEGSSEEAKR